MPFEILSERTAVTLEGKTLGVRVERYSDASGGPSEAPTIRFYWITPLRPGDEKRRAFRHTPKEDFKGKAFWNATEAYYDLDTFNQTPGVESWDGTIYSGITTDIDLGDGIGTLDVETQQILAGWFAATVARAAQDSDATPRRDVPRDRGRFREPRRYPPPPPPPPRATPKPFVPPGKARCSICGKVGSKANLAKHRATCRSSTVKESGSIKCREEYCSRGLGHSGEHGSPSFPGLSGRETRSLAALQSAAEKASAKADRSERRQDHRDALAAHLLAARAAEADGNQDVRWHHEQRAERHREIVG